MIDKHKVLFVQEISEGEFETESIWCYKVNDEIFIVDNIPFIAKRISLGDTIKVDYDKNEKAYYFDDFIEVSGNSTIRVYFNDENMIKSTRKKLDEFNCKSEAFLERNMISINVPSNVNYTPIKLFLENGENNKNWEYEESCLMHEY